MSESTAFDSEKIKECAGWLQDCTAIFNGPKLWHPEIAVYLKAVCCPDPDKVIEALKHWLLNERHFPTPVDIRLRIRQIEAGEKRHEEAKEYIMLDSTAFDNEKIQQCASWLRDCAIIFDRPKLSHHDVAAYLKAVCCPDPDRVIEALKRWLPNERHFPSPVDIRHVIEQKAGDKEYIALESTPFESGKHRECVHLLRLIAHFYDTPHLSDPDIAAYFNAVHCTDADKVHQALEDWLCHGRGFPSPEDIRSRIRKLDEGGPLNAPLSPSESWKCRTANPEGQHPQAVHGAGAHPAASGSVEKSALPRPSNKDVSQ